MKVAVYYNNRNIDIEERPIPEPGEGEILVQTKACGVCVGDTMEWYLTPRAPMVMGHEATGIVARTGKGVKNVREGDRVFVHHHVPCLICDSCLKGRYTSCATFRATHYNPGGFAEYFLASAHHVAVDTLILPEQVGFVEGTLIEPLACVIHALRLAAIKSEESVVLVGTGAMGLMFIQVLLHYGIRKLVVYELLPWRQEIARRFGAPVVLSPLEEPGAEAERLQSILSAEGADKVLVVAKDLSAINMGMQLAGRGGTILLFATTHPEEKVDFYPSRICLYEQSVLSSYSADHLDTREALDLLSQGVIDSDTIITHRFPLEGLSDAILHTQGRKESLKCVIEI